MKGKWITAVVVALSSVLFSAPLAVAAPGGHGHGRGDKLAEKLNLSDAQKQQWQDLERSFHQDNKAFLQQARQTRKEIHDAVEANDMAKVQSLEPTFQANRTQMKQLHEAQEQKLMAVLNDEQKAQFQQLKAERQSHRRQRP